MPRIARTLSCSLLTLCGLVACAQVATPGSEKPAPTQSEGATTPAAAKTPEIVNSPLGAKLMYELLVTEISFRTGNAQGAAASMLDIAQRHNDSALYERAVQMAAQARSGRLALRAARDWSKAFPQSLDAGRYELQILLALGHVAQSGQPVTQLLNALPADEKVPFIIALPAIYERSDDKAVALETVQKALSDALNTPALAPAAWTTVGRMRLIAGDAVGARDAAARGQEAAVGSRWPALLALQLFSGGDKEAQPLIERYLQQPDADPRTRLDYAQALSDQGDDAAAQVQIALLQAMKPGYALAWLEEGRLELTRGLPQEAKTALTHYMVMVDAGDDAAKAENADGMNDARLLLARIAERRGAYAEAERLLDAIDTPDPALDVIVQRANLIAHGGDLGRARRLIEDMPDQSPDDAELKLVAVAQLLREHGDAAGAYHLIAEALKATPDSTRLLYEGAMDAESLDQVSDMQRLLRRLIILHPDAAFGYNALGYSLANRNIQLDEAKELIEHAVKLAPDDSYIQDSLGWVQFRLGNVQQAQDTLQRAYDRTHDPEIAAHLGEVLWAQGKRKQAQAIWTRALQNDTQNDVLNETIRRLQNTAQ